MLKKVRQSHIFAIYNGWLMGDLFDCFAHQKLPVDTFKTATTPFIFEDRGLHLQQESLKEDYSFCLITEAPEPRGTDEPLDVAISELRALLLGFQIDLMYSPISLGDGDLFDFTYSKVMGDPFYRSM